MALDRPRDLQAAVGDHARERREVGPERLALLGRVDEEPDEAAERAAGEVVEVQRRRLAARYAVGDRAAAGGEVPDRVGEQRAADPVDHDVERAVVLAERRRDDALRAERLGGLRPVGAADMRGDVRAPATASWTAKQPTPPVAPVTSTRRPSRLPPTRSVRSAVRPATGSAAAAANDTPSGIGATREAATATRSDQPPPSASATTRVPLPSASTPATSCPGCQPSGRCSSRESSPRLTA